MNPVDFSVVIPVYNNSATLNELMDRLIATLEPLAIEFELVFVDDGSRDDSLEILEHRAAADARIRPFALARNFGSQSAVCAGFDQIRGRRAMCMDADLENVPEDIPRLLAPLDQGYDLVCGYRQQRRAPWLSRRLPSLMMNAYVRRQTGTHIRDLGCGMRTFESYIVRNLSEEGEARRLLTPVFLKRAHRVAEVPLSPETKPGVGGHSFLTLLGIAVDYYLLTAKRPFLFLGIVAVAFAVIGVLAIPLAPPLISILLLGSGLLGLVICLAGEYTQRLYVLGQRLPFYELRDLVDTPAAAVELLTTKSSINQAHETSGVATV